MMQKTRQRILSYLKKHGDATVDELSDALDNLTAVTVRHHLDVLRSQDLIAPPTVRHCNSPGRPKYIYRLTEKAEAMFPKNLNTLADHLLSELKGSFDEQQINAFFSGVADRMASELPPGAVDEPFERRLERVAAHLTEHGYEAHWESHPEGFMLHTGNCPYGDVIETHEEICALDARYISRLLGITPRRVKHRGNGEHCCSYLIMIPKGQTV
jgi:DeoR family suf operon transcriptional repressor